MLHKLVFDATDSNTQLASSNVGAYIRASDGTLITHTGGALDVNIATSDIAIDVDLDAATDSVQAWAHDGTGNALTSTSGALDVNIDNASIAVTATDLDIRDLVFATDKVDVTGSEVSLDSATLAALENITVSATNLDIRDLVFATDKVDVTGSEVSLDSATLAALENITVSATDLDIRDLTHASDSVKVGDGTDFLAVNSDGSINVAQATTTALSAVAETVGTSAAAIVDGGDELANRRKLFMYNNGNRNMYIGPTGVTTSTGFPIPPGSILEIESGAAMDVFAIADAAGQNMRTLQLA